MTCPTCQHSRDTGWTGLPTGTFHCGDSVSAGVVGCHVNWTGANRQHTVCCHRTFSGESADSRYHHPKGHPERCATEDEMREAGAVLRDGVWGGPSPSAETMAKLRAASDSGTPPGEIGTVSPAP